MTPEDPAPAPPPLPALSPACPGPSPLERGSLGRVEALGRFIRYGLFKSGIPTAQDFILLVLVPLFQLGNR